MWKKVAFLFPALVFATLALGVCDPEGEEPAPVPLPVVADGSQIAPCTNDEGWTIALDALRAAVQSLEFTIEGETHASLIERISDLAVPSATAHPGHYAGGEVTGELPGDFVIDFVAGDGAALGEASLLPGDYNGMNLYFRAATAADGLAEGDPLIGHTAVISGTATRDAATVQFEAVIDIDEGTQMVGGPFELVVEEGTSATLGLAAFTIDPSENDTLFDGLDFGALDADGDGLLAIAPGDEAHNVLSKTFVRHDHWGVTVQ
jgi:hypothetical protein